MVAPVDKGVFLAFAKMCTHKFDVPRLEQLPRLQWNQLFNLKPVGSRTPAPSYLTVGAPGTGAMSSGAGASSSAPSNIDEYETVDV